MAAAKLNPIEAALRRVAEDLRAVGRPWALIGGLAVGARAEPRTTRDVDLMVRVADDADAEAVVYALQSIGYRVLAVLEHTSAGRLATVRLRPPGGGSLGPIVDLLFASSGIEAEVVDEAEAIAIVEDLLVPVATIGHLVALKVLARDDRRRPQDADDLRALLQEASETDVTQAKAALRLIEQRGYARGKDLVTELEHLLADR